MSVFDDLLLVVVSYPDVTSAVDAEPPRRREASQSSFQLASWVRVDVHGSGVRDVEETKRLASAATHDFPPLYPGTEPGGVYAGRSAKLLQAVKALATRPM